VTDLPQSSSPVSATDIVVRLRRSTDPFWHHERPELVGEAADEIEKLRRDKKMVEAQATSYAHELAAGLAQTPDYIRKLEQDVAKLRAFAESFHVTVVDNFYKDVTLVLEQPHTLAIRLQNDSTKSWIFADLEERRRAALSDTSTLGNSK
jgi:hypothetical protein